MSLEQYLSQPWIIDRAIILLAILIFSISLWQIGSKVNQFENKTQSLSDCVALHSNSEKKSDEYLSEMAKTYAFCYNALGSQLKLDQEELRRDLYADQRHQNDAMLFMVVTITLSGVALAGLQLLASYRLASKNSSSFEQGETTISYSKDDVSLKSSVIGISILGLSFAFFLVFVMYVYRIDDATTSPGNLPVGRAIPIVPPATEKSDLPIPQPLGSSKQ